MDKTGSLVTISGGDLNAEETLMDVPVQHPRSVAVDSVGTLFFADESNQIRKVDESGSLIDFAGSGNYGSDGDGDTALEASFFSIACICFDAGGNLFIADSLNHKIRIVDTNGIVDTVAGNGTEGHSGDGGPASEAQLNEPVSVAVGQDGSVYIADYNNHRIRKVDSNGQISTVAGTGGSGFTTGKGDPLKAEVGHPNGIFVGDNDDIYFSSGCRICNLDSAGKLSNVGGTGARGYTGDGGLATEAEVGSPGDIVVDRDGYLFFCDTENHVVRRIDPLGIISTVAGTGENGCNGDGEGTKTQLSQPYGLALDMLGNLYIADFANHRLRKLCAVAATEIGTTIEEAGGMEYEIALLEKQLNEAAEDNASFSAGKGSGIAGSTSPIPGHEINSEKSVFSQPPPFEENEGKGYAALSWTPGSPLEEKESEIHTRSFQEYIRRAPEGIPAKGSSNLLELFKQLNIDEKHLIPFVDHEIEVSDIVDLTTEDLQSLIPVIGPRNRLLKHIESLRSTQEEDELEELRRKVEEYESLQEQFVMKERELKDREHAYKEQQQENLSLVGNDDGIIRKGGKEYKLVEISDTEVCQKCVIM